MDPHTREIAQGMLQKSGIRSKGHRHLLKAPEACAERGKTDKAVEIALDLDLIREVNTFLSATA